MSRLHLCAVLSCLALGVLEVPFAYGQKVYWSDRGTRTISRADLDGSNIEVIITLPVKEPYGVAVDGPGGKVYWTALPNGVIQRANMDGSGVETLVTFPVGSGSYGMNLELSIGKMYWTMIGDTPVRVHRANLDGTDVEDLYGDDGLLGGLGIAADSSSGKVYFAAYGIPNVSRLSRADLNGAGAMTLISNPQVSYPEGIAIDSASGRLYWAEVGNPAPPGVKRSQLNGAGITTLVAGAPARALALDHTGGKMYWVEGIPGAMIRRADLDGSNVETVIAATGNSRGVALCFARYGDVAPPGNGVIDVDDILYAVEGFVDPAGHRGVDLFPCGGDGIVDVDDLSAALQAFMGNFACPDPC